MNRYRHCQENGQVYVIAEVGINHNGSYDEARALIEEAVKAGADGVKIQVRNLASIYTSDVLADPLKAEQGTQYLLSELKKVELTPEETLGLFEFAKQFPVDFFAAPFDLDSARFLHERDVPLFKIGSPDFTNLPLLKTIAGFGKPMILSTGMCSEEEIIQVVGLLREWGADFTLLHCNSTYPASVEDIHLRYMERLREIGSCPVGYSGHERGYAPTVAAVALGARVVERHITRDTAAEGPDHSASLDFADFAAMVDAVRRVEAALGSTTKVFNQGERVNRVALGKALVAAQDLPAGHVLTEEDMVAKTPARGLSPLEMPSLMGRTLRRDVTKDESIRMEDLEGAAEASSLFHIPKTWGVVGRLNDFEGFLDMKPDLIEVHLTWRDIGDYAVRGERFKDASYDQDFVVHAPEYYQDRLIDFTSEDPEVTEFSLEMLSKTLDLARDLGGRFKGQTDPRGPRVVVHPGGHFETKVQGSTAEQYRRLNENLRSVNLEGVRLLVENLPPFPWYFGGQWYQSMFTDPAEVARFAREFDWGICYDTSHALLYCNSRGIGIEKFTEEVLPHVEYLHISDAKDTTQEGLQLGDGNLSFDHVLALLGKLDVGFVPEIWQGHLNRGEGFRQALRTIEGLLSGKLATRGCHDHEHEHQHTDVMAEAGGGGTP